MGLKIFDTLYTQAAEDIKEVNTLLNDFKKSDYDSELASITNDLILLNGKQKDFKKDERDLKKQIKEVLNEIKEETKRLKPVDSNIRDYKTLEEEKKKLDLLVLLVIKQSKLLFNIFQKMRQNLRISSVILSKT